ncbi:MAG: radical SAM family heme chaperone HemW [Deltaproteobacteria bacterium]|nr:radical SAM family heme chaperone HemW [Deltaproteobacteria bacterium]
MFGVYVHAPWCRIHCPYCAFFVDTRAEVPHEEWLAGIRRDWARERPHFPGPPRTLAFGGGTPSRLLAAHVAALVAEVQPEGEVSLEANPEDIDAGTLAAWSRAGVDRLTIGVQSFVPAVARRLGRAHTARQAEAAVELAMESGLRSVGIDLIFGAEGQALADLEEDLDLAVALGVDHVSLYGLSIEEGTDYARRGRRPADDDTWREMYDLGVARLHDAGLIRYEVSNFARAGHRSAHNETYWRGGRWMGLGPSAHGWRPDNARVANPADWAAWASGAAPSVETPAPEALLRELLWSTLRHIDGVELATTRALTGIEVRLPATLRDAGLLRAAGGAILLERDGFPLADALAEALWAASTDAAAEPGAYSRLLAGS